MNLKLNFFIVDVCTINSGIDKIDLKVLQHNFNTKKMDNLNLKIRNVFEEGTSVFLQTSM